MDNKDLEWLVAIVVLAALLCGTYISVHAYDTVDDPCGSGGLEECDMQPLITPDQCHRLALPEAWYCERRARHGNAA